MAASVGLDRKPERGAKRGGDTFHPLAVPSVYALHVCGLVSLAVLCLSVPASFFFFLQTLTKNEESNSHVDKDPGESQELHQVVHKQVAFLQPEVG